MYYPNLSYRKIGPGLYAYFPISPMVSKAYFITSAQKDRIQSLQSRLTIKLVITIPFKFVSPKLLGVLGGWIGVLPFLGVILLNRFEKKKILAGCELQLQEWHLMFVSSIFLSACLVLSTGTAVVAWTKFKSK